MPTNQGRCLLACLDEKYVECRAPSGGRKNANLDGKNSYPVHRRNAAKVAQLRAAEIGRIVLRVDGLPLTWSQWRLALITQIFWNVIIAADGIPAKLYLVVWEPKHSFGTGAHSVLLSVQFGIGIFWLANI